MDLHHDPQTLLYWVKRDTEPNIDSLCDLAKKHRADRIDCLYPINKKYAH
jgi:hypothetical protein